MISNFDFNFKTPDKYEVIIPELDINFFLDFKKDKKIIFIEKNWIRINLDNKFITRTGRINCSVLDKDSQWRWMGFQMVMDGIK